MGSRALAFLALLYLPLVLALSVPTSGHYRRQHALSRPRSLPLSLTRPNEANHTLLTRDTLPAGWSLYQANGNDGGGCYEDTSSRVLSTYIGSGYGIASCLGACSAQGMGWAGVEYGGECYCSATTPSLTNAASSTCNVNCPGSPGTCGGSWRLNVYTTQSSSWSYTACVSDGDNRALTGYFFSSSAMTVALCTSTCSSKGFSLAGVEYGIECYCGNSYANGRGSTLSASSCDSTCTGGGSNCGGSWALSIYTSAVVSWSYVGCYSDSSTRTLAYKVDGGSTSVQGCLASCHSKGYSYGGIEYSSECYCANSVLSSTKKLENSVCSASCPAGGTGCGGTWALSLWKYGSASDPVTTTTTTTTTTSTTTTTNAAATNTASSYQPTNNVPASSATKYIWAHHMVGNTYPYTYDTWMTDIRLAAANGIDGFVLNIGYDSWQPARVADAYNAAANSGTGFKMMISFDMSVFSCDDWRYGPLFQTYLGNYMYHSAAAKVNGKTAVTTFAGSSCTFGKGSTNAGWASIFGGYKDNIYFMPAYTNDPASLPGYDIQAEVNWGSAWPSGGGDIETSRDQWFMQQLNPSGKKYVGTLAPAFFTHFGYKNWLWRGDNWLYAMRWEHLISMRASIDQVEIVSWNDFGESSYIGPIVGDMPAEAKLWATDSFPHTDILSLQAFYATAWKTGHYPTITQDKVWLMARPHPASAGAWGDSVGPPDHRDYTKDDFYVQAHLVGTATVTLCAGSSCNTVTGNPGINRFSHSLVTGQGVSVKVVRNGQTTVNLVPNFTFDGNPQRHNFNYLIKSS